MIPKIVIKQPWGGLGDNLAFSSIPETAYNQFGTKCVWISNHNVYRYGNSEIKKLVWELNPYIAGFTDDDSSVPNFKVDRNIGMIGTIERVYGLNPTSLYPKIYYTYDLLKEEMFKNKIFIDFSSSAENITAREQSVWNALENYLRKMNTDKKEIYRIVFPNLENKEKFLKNYKLDLNNIFNKIVGEYPIHNLFEYCDLIKFCDTLICSNSGQHALAAAIKDNAENPTIINYCSRRWYYTGLYNFKNVCYVTD